MHIRTTVLTFFTAAFLVSGAAVAAAQDAHEVRVGSNVNITTCVVPSLDEDDEFVLTNIVDVPAHPPYAGKVVYWVSDWKKIRDFVGKRIQFDATIRDVDRKEIEVKWADTNSLGDTGGNGSSAFAEIELAGNNVRTSPETIGLSSGQAMDEVEIPSTLVKVKLLNTPTVVSGSCDTAAMRTAAASSTSTLDVETRTETETRTAVTETARVDAPAAEVEVAAAAETPAVAAEAERVTEVAEVASPAPAAPEVDTRAEAPMTTERTELPATATPLPLVLLLGLGSLTGAGVLRRLRN
jgi:hypothetical protein